MITAKEARSNFSTPEYNSQLEYINKQIILASETKTKIELEVSRDLSALIASNLTDRGFDVFRYCPQNESWSLSIEW